MTVSLDYVILADAVRELIALITNNTNAGVVYRVTVQDELDRLRTLTYGVPTQEEFSSYEKPKIHDLSLEELEYRIRKFMVWNTTPQPSALYGHGALENYVLTIKETRKLSGLGLKEAKDYVDALILKVLEEPLAPLDGSKYEVKGIVSPTAIEKELLGKMKFSPTGVLMNKVHCIAYVSKVLGLSLIASKQYVEDVLAEFVTHKQESKIS